MEDLDKGHHLLLSSLSVCWHAFDSSVGKSNVSNGYRQIAVAVD